MKPFSVRSLVAHRALDVECAEVAMAGVIASDEVIVMTQAERTRGCDSGKGT